MQFHSIGYEYGYLFFSYAEGTATEKKRPGKEKVLSDFVMVRLNQISENSERLTEAFKDQHSEIRWHTIRGLHNRMVHEYGNVDLKVIYNTVKDD